MSALETAPSVEGAPGKRTPGRAGRDLPAAIAVGVGLALLVVVPLYSPYRWLFVGVIVAAVAVGTYEVLQALCALGARPPALPLTVGGAASVVVAYRAGPEALLLGLLLTVLACLLWRLARPARGYLRDVACAAFTATYVPFLAGFAALLAEPADGPRRVTAFIAVVVCSDVGGYAAGVLLGRHPMAPSVSPKKSWEGFGGSLLAGAVGGALLLLTLFDASPLGGALYGAAIAATATLGDLGESMVKRDIGIKDMGDLLPGHGGLMDRLDSLLPSAPVAWLLLLALAPPG
ncbi:MAG: phosphatidate cytidylyltransferase [Actinomycetota bacterium]|nr:phosphatidate cytidylyltransferase [Actinomycetota bacterium]